MFNPTEEQEKIFTSVAAGANCMVEALAGCAKSSTIRESLSHIPRGKTIAILAFNRKIKEEMEAAVRAAGHTAKILTMNGLGHNALRKGLGRSPEVKTDKMFTLAKGLGLNRKDLGDVMALARAARQAGVVPRGVGRGLIPDDDETWEGLAEEADIHPALRVPARDLLVQSTKQAMQGIIDYDDQIYVSTLIFGSYDKFDVLFVDEAQDLSPLNHLQVAKAARGQIIAVGDSHQAIYAWRGADSESMQNLRRLRESWDDRTLSVTFRCPSSVVERQRDFVPLFTAAPSNLRGEIRRLSEWFPSGGAQTAVLCRNNAPLIRLAFTLLRRHVPVNFLGKDIGADLKRFYNKLSNHGKKSVSDTISAAEAYAEKEPAKADKADSLIAILESFDNVDEALRFLSTPAADSLILATGHKAKGMEWDTVYHLNPGLIPSKSVREMEPEPENNYSGDKEDQYPTEAYTSALRRYEAALAQENNLRYVIETRTRDKLFFVSDKGLA